MIITFIYKFKGDHKIYYGKYIGYITDDYEEGLDKELASTLYSIFEKHYSISSMDDVVIGILSFYRDTSDYFSENEANIFDLLCCEWSIGEPELYLDGKLIKK
jgi:hypothetical protein